VAAGEQVVPASELAAAMKQIKELQRLLGKKNLGSTSYAVDLLDFSANLWGK
ncbi:hypothetical protein G3W16_26095, partial [Klebsiella pneumoniae]|nr:hypothetical protein [Klebsiella pneumoniae]